MPSKSAQVPGKDCRWCSVGKARTCNIRVRSAALLGLGVSLFLQGCSTQVLEPLPALPETPAYTQVPHPSGFDIADARMIFSSPLAPKPEEREKLKTCDAGFHKVLEQTRSRDELSAAARELVTSDPVFYHWCFYTKLLEVNDYVTDTASWSDRQKKVLSTYLFLVPLARSFKIEFHDSRYLRWATKQYRDLSEWVFFRKLELGSDATMELLDGVNNPFALWRKPTPAEKSVLEKYGIPVARDPASGGASEAVQQSDALTSPEQPAIPAPGDESAPSF